MAAHGLIQSDALHHKIESHPVSCYISSLWVFGSPLPAPVFQYGANMGSMMDSFGSHSFGRPMRLNKNVKGAR
jgi:hypothetical protein